MLPLFAGIARDDLSHFSAALGRLVLPAGHLLVSANQPGEIAYVILAGTLRVFLADPEGNEITLALLGSGEIAGESAVLGNEVHTASVVAHEPVVLLAISQSVFADARRNLPCLADNLFGILAARIRYANALALALATLDVPGRVARQLLLLADAYGRPAGAGILIPIRITQDDLGSFVGATRVRVNQAIGKFRRNGLLRVDDQYRFVILDVDRLALISNRCVRCNHRRVCRWPAQHGIAIPAVGD